MKNRITIISVLISLTSHVFLFAVPAFFTGTVFEDNRNKEIEVEIVRVLPEFDRVEEQNELGGFAEGKSFDKGIQLENSEKEADFKITKARKITKIKNAIELIDNNDSVLKYQNAVKQKIEANRMYPKWAVRQGTGGTVELEFVVYSNGSIGEIMMVNSSGSSILDKGSISTIKGASPFPCFPDSINLPFIKIKVDLIYRI